MEEIVRSSLIAHNLRLAVLLTESLRRTILKIFRFFPADQSQNEAVDSLPFGSHFTVLRFR